MCPVGGGQSGWMEKPRLTVVYLNQNCSKTSMVCWQWRCSDLNTGRVLNLTRLFLDLNPTKPCCDHNHVFPIVTTKTKVQFSTTGTRCLFIALTHLLPLGVSGDTPVGHMWGQTVKQRPEDEDSMCFACGSWKLFRPLRHSFLCCHVHLNLKTINDTVETYWSTDVAAFKRFCKSMI